MKTVTVNVQIQFDLNNDQEVNLSNVLKALDAINLALQSDELSSMSPQIFTEAIDVDDIHHDEGFDNED